MVLRRGLDWARRTVQRVRRREGLRVRGPARRPRCPARPEAKIKAEGVNDVWCVDLVFDATRHGVTLKFLTIVDEGRHYCDRDRGRAADARPERLKTPLYGWNDKIRTAELVASQWGDDPEVSSKQTAGFTAPRLPEPIVIALSLGWPDSEPPTNYHEACVNEKRLVATHVWHEPGAVFASPERIIKVVTRLAITRDGKNACLFRESANYYATRPRRDDDAKRAFLMTLEQAK